MNGIKFCVKFSGLVLFCDIGQTGIIHHIPQNFRL